MRIILLLSLGLLSGTCSTAVAQSCPANLSGRLTPTQQARLRWVVPATGPRSSFQLERSLNNRTFTVAAELGYAAAHDSTAARASFEHLAAEPLQQPTYYRLCVRQKGQGRSYTPALLLVPGQVLRPDSATVSIRVYDPVTGQQRGAQVVPAKVDHVCWDLRPGNYVMEAEHGGRRTVAWLRVD